MVILFAISAVIVALIIKSGGDSKTLQDDTSMLIIGIAFLLRFDVGFPLQVLHH